MLVDRLRAEQAGREGHMHTYSQQIESQAFELPLEEGLSAHADQH